MNRKNRLPTEFETHKPNESVKLQINLEALMLHTNKAQVARHEYIS
jgi:hypothetical protein